MADALTKFITVFFYFGPLVFAAGFLWPLFAQILDRMALSPFGLTPVLAGFIMASVLGLAAQLRGSWI